MNALFDLVTAIYFVNLSMIFDTVSIWKKISHQQSPEVSSSSSIMMMMMYACVLCVFSVSINKATNCLQRLVNALCNVRLQNLVECQHRLS